MENKYTAVDLDGTLAHFDEWRGLDHIGEPMDYAEAGMTILKVMGFEVIVHTCRAKEGYDHIRNWFKKYDIPFDYINQNPEQPDTAGLDGKMFANWYIDDRNPSFESFIRSVRIISANEVPRPLKCSECLEYKTCKTIKPSINDQKARGCTGYLPNSEVVDEMTNKENTNIQIGTESKEEEI